MSCHDYEGVMPVLCTPLQVKCYLKLFPSPTHKLFSAVLFKFVQTKYKLFVCAFNIPH